MFKLMAFLNRREGTTLDEMRNHYENHHVPLALKTFPQIREHRRNYADQSSAMFGPGAPGLGYDVISELWFEDRAGFDGMLAILADPVASAAIKEDELRFLDPSRCGMVIVEEETTRAG